LIFVLAAGTVLAASSEEVLDKADQFIQAKQYDSAFQLLSDADKNSKNPKIVLKQEL
jgi:hypothetical protein